MWTFDEIFSTTSPSVVNSVRRFYSPGEFGAVPFDLSGDALSSPGRFAGYVADAVFKTLPLQVTAHACKHALKSASKRTISSSSVNGVPCNEQSEADRIRPRSP